MSKKANRTPPSWWEYKPTKKEKQPTYKQLKGLWKKIQAGKK